MKKTICALTLVFLCMTASPLWAQCVAEIKDVIQDEQRGSIIVETQYKLNGVIVGVDALPCDNCVGRSRYTEETGTNEEIIALAKQDIEQHCENLIKRITDNKDFINTEMLKQQKSLTSPIITAIEKDLEGQKITKTESTIKFKGKDIKVTYDKKNTVSDSVITP